MIMLKADKENITVKVEGYNGYVVYELAGILEALKNDDRLSGLMRKVLLLRTIHGVLEGGATESDKQSDSDRALN